MTGFGLAEHKPEGGIWFKDKSHPLSGKSFMAYRDAYQQYSGEATVIRQKKGGMMLCIKDNGEEFEETLTKIKRHLIEDAQ